jgi:nucleotide sugar dehydrogenase
VPDPVTLGEPAVFTHDVAIVGLGYVGLPTALAYHHAGRSVLALDVSERRLDDIANGAVDAIASDRDRLTDALESSRFELTSDVAQLRTARAVIICVPTPVDAHLVPDLGILGSACATVAAHAVPGQLVVLTSTTYVGCTAELLGQPLAERGLVVGEDVHLAFSAERIDPGSTVVAQEQVPRVVGGATPECLERAVDLLAGYADSVHPVPCLETAEMTKLLENTFRAVNIALANEFADVCTDLGLDVVDVIGAAATKPYGFMPFWPGPGVGGHCIPCDPHYLLWQLRRSGVEVPVMDAAMHQIAARPGRVVERVRKVLSDRGLGLGGARVLVMGVAYKPGVADLRESPALEIMEMLRREGAEVGFVDPYIDSARLPDGTQLQGVSDPRGFQPTLVLVHTAHPGMDVSWMTPHQLVLDATFRTAVPAERVTL